MRDETRRRLSELILEELSEKIKRRESLGQKLEAFTDLPVEKVAEAILKQFEYLLSSELRDLIFHMIEQEIAADRASHEVLQAEPAAEERLPEPVVVERAPEPPPPAELPALTPPLELEPEPEPETSTESIMEHFGTREPFASEPMDIPLDPSDWFYIYGFSYAPISTGKGVPTKKLKLKGADGLNTIFLVDSGDIRLYLSKLSKEDYSLDRSGKPTLTTQKATGVRYQHERILNTLRTEEVIVSVPCWTLMLGLAGITALIEDRYVELLRALIDVHDAVDWDVEVFALDEHIVSLPEIADAGKSSKQRETKHASGKTRDIKVMEKLIFKEKSLAQEVHSSLLLLATKAKVDYMIRLDNALMEDWKSILLARYIVPKDKRKAFCLSISDLQEEYKVYQLMIRLTSPATRFTLNP